MQAKRVRLSGRFTPFQRFQKQEHELPISQITRNNTQHVVGVADRKQTVVTVDGRVTENSWVFVFLEQMYLVWEVCKNVFLSATNAMGKQAISFIQCKFHYYFVYTTYNFISITSNNKNNL